MAAVFLGIGGAGVWQAEAHLSMQGRFLAYNHRRIDDFERRLPAAGARPFVVVALGTSLLRAGTPDDDEMNEALRQAAGGRQVAWLRIARNDGYMEDFAPLAEAIWRLRPSLILIQADLLRGGTRKPTRHPVARMRAFVQQLVADPGRLQVWQTTTLLEQATRKECGSPLSPWVFEAKLSRALDEVQFAAELEDHDIAFLRQAKARGVSVALLEVPRSASIDRVVRASRLRWFRKLDRQAGAFSYVVWRYPSVFPDNAYCDYVHLNREGRAVLSRWLIGRLLGRGGEAR